MKRTPWQEILVDPATLALLPEEPDEKEAVISQAVLDAIDSFDAQELEIFRMKFGELLSTREIAKRLGFASHSTVRYHLDRMYQKVKDAIADNSTDD